MGKDKKKPPTKKRSQATKITTNHDVNALKICACVCWMLFFFCVFLMLQSCRKWGKDESTIKPTREKKCVKQQCQEKKRIEGSGRRRIVKLKINMPKRKHRIYAKKEHDAIYKMSHRVWICTKYGTSHHMCICYCSGHNVKPILMCFFSLFFDGLNRTVRLSILQRKKKTPKQN